MSGNVQTYWIGTKLGFKRGGTGTLSSGIGVSADRSSPGDVPIRIEVRDETQTLSLDAIACAIEIWEKPKTQRAGTIAAEIAETIEASRSRNRGALTVEDLERAVIIANTESALMREGLVPSDAFEDARATVAAGSDVDLEKVDEIVEHEQDRLPERHLAQGGIEQYDRLRAPVRALRDVPYSPACGSEWTPSVCEKPRVR